MSTRLGAQAIGQIRQLRRQLRAEGERLKAAVDSISLSTIEAIAFKGRKAADLAWHRAMAVTPPPYYIGPHRRLALWRVLRPVEQVLERDGELVGDGTVLTTCIILGRTAGGARRLEDHWGFAATNHALGRVLERTMFRADPAAAMLEAHEAVLTAPVKIATGLEVGTQWAVPGGPGAFLCTLQRTSDDSVPISILSADTWVSSDQLRPEQAAQATAMRYRQPGAATLGEAWFLPPVLRGVVQGGGKATMDKTTARATRR